MAVQGDINEIMWGASATSGSNTAMIGISRVWEDKTTYEYCKVYVWIYTAKAFYDSNNNLTLTVDGKTLINGKLGINVGAGNTILKEAEINFDKQSAAREVIFNASLSGLELVDVTLSASRPYVIEPLPSYTLDVGTYNDGVKNDIGGEVTFDVYLNDVLNSNDVIDWCQSVSHGTTYSIKDIKPKAGYVYNGVHSGSLSGTVKGTTSVYLSVSKKKYTIQYDANGGTDAPASQSKEHGTSLTLSNTVPSRTGYTFLGWSTSETATSADYYAGGSYTTNESVTLYAVWTAISYKVTYQGNTGTSVEYGSSWSNTATYGEEYTTPSCMFEKIGYEFVGWNEKADGTGADWSDSINVPFEWQYTRSVTLYAQWKVKANCRIKEKGINKLGMVYVKKNGKYYLCIISQKRNGKYKNSIIT